MQKTATQLTLGLRLKDEATFDNFFPGRNDEVIAALKKSASGSGEKVIYLYGARSEGLSHLLQASCHEAQQFRTPSVYLPLAMLSCSPDILNGLESLALVCVDDVHVIAGLPEWEEAIFHLYNRVREKNGSIIFAANDLPHAIQLKLPDLVSRLRGGVIYRLHTLADEEKLQALIMRAARRGMSLSEEVGKYLLRHYPRHMGALFTALDLLDKASLTAQRRITLPFVKEVLNVHDSKYSST